MGALIRAVTLTVMLAVLGEFVIVSETQATQNRAVYTQVDQQIFGTRSAPAQGQSSTQLGP